MHWPAEWHGSEFKSRLEILVFPHTNNEENVKSSRKMEMNSCTLSQQILYFYLDQFYYTDETFQAAGGPNY